MERRGDWMQTYSGRKFWPCDPRADEVRIEDIAHSLSMQCRFAGHSTDFYSVAEHCVRASWIVPPTFALAALLHDAAEAYVVDLPRPVKRWPPLWPYLEIEERVHAVIREAFGITIPLDDETIKRADEIMLATEARDLMGGESAGKWRLHAEPLAGTILPWDHRRARQKYRDRFRDLFVPSQA